LIPLAHLNFCCTFPSPGNKKVETGFKRLGHENPQVSASLMRLCPHHFIKIEGL
jgi:hypothetical protein